MVRSLLKWPVLWVVIVGWALFVTPPLANATAKDQASAAELLLELADGVHSTALLLEMDIAGEINGLVATLTLRQRFRNPSDQWVNGRYVFPMPDRAAIDSLTLETDGRVIRGAVKEKEQAKKEFVAAKTSGKKAALMQQNRPNLFSMSLANIAPGGEVIASITWVETVRFDHGVFSLRLPTTLTPRYIPGYPIVATIDGKEFVAEQSLTIDTASGWSQNTDQVPDAANVTPPQIRSTDSQNSHLFSIALTLDAGIPLAEITSTTHGINVIPAQQQSFRAERQHIGFINESEPMDRDLVLNWKPVASNSPTAAAFTRQGPDGNYTLLMLTPPVNNVVQTLPREVIFIIDSSGSMAGISMPQAKQGLQAALGHLSPGDRFNIIDFDSNARAIFGIPMMATQSYLAHGSQFVKNLVADGGTNMEAALSLAFSQPATEGYLRQIVFITDGSVGNERNLFDLIHRRLGDARLFTMGIGSAPNSHFMRGAAHFGRGSFHYIDSLNQAASSMNELFSKIDRPVMQDIEVQWPENITPEYFPAPLPDLYIGEPLMLIAKSDRPIGEIHISGKLAGSSWQRTINASEGPAASGIDKLWARRKIEFLESEEVIGGLSTERVRKEITALGVHHQLATRYTSFIAVEDEPSRPIERTATESELPNLMPNGNTMMVPMPNTATGATLLIILGSMLLFFAAAIWRLNPGRPVARNAPFRA